MPLWKVNGVRYPGRFDDTQLAAIVGAQGPNQRAGRPISSSPNSQP